MESGEPDHVQDFSPPDDISREIAGHVLNFLVDELARPGESRQAFFPSRQAWAISPTGLWQPWARSPDIPPFQMYTEVLQNAMVDLMVSEKLIGASACSLTITSAKLQQIVDNFDFFAPRIVLRPQEISNHPGIIRRLGVVAMNTALEFDIYGNVNSSHLFGTQVMNGIGGSGEFTRNSYLSIFMAPSVAKGGSISAQSFPCARIIDNNEHSVQVVVTEQGLADLREDLGPMQRAQKDHRTLRPPALQGLSAWIYVQRARVGHIRQDLDRCFELHRNFLAIGCHATRIVIDPFPDTDCHLIVTLRPERFTACGRHGDQTKTF